MQQQNLTFHFEGNRLEVIEFNITDNEVSVQDKLEKLSPKNDKDKNDENKHFEVMNVKERYWERSNDKYSIGSKQMVRCN